MRVCLPVRWGEEWPTVGCWPTSRTFSPWVCGPTGRGDLNYFYQHFLWRLAIFLLSCLQAYHSNHLIKYAAFCKCACWAPGAAEQPVLERIERGRIFWTQGDIGTLSKSWPWIFIPMFHHEAAQFPAAPLHSRFFCFLIILLLALKLDLRIPLLAFLIPLYSMTSSGATDSIKFLKEKNLLGPAPLPRPCHWSPARLQTIWAPSTEPRLAVLSTACGWGTWRLKSRTSQGTGHSLQHSSAEIIWRQESRAGLAPVSLPRVQIRWRQALWSTVGLALEQWAAWTSSLICQWWRTQRPTSES